MAEFPINTGFSPDLAIGLAKKNPAINASIYYKTGVDLSKLNPEDYRTDAQVASNPANMQEMLIGLARQQQDIANKSYARSEQPFNDASSFYTSLLNGGPALQKTLSPSINAINSQWDQAYKNTVNGAYSRGGAMDKALRAVQMGRAVSLSDLYNNAQAGGAAGLTQLAGFGSGASSGLAGAAQTLAAAQNAALQQQQAKQQALFGVGSLITQVLSSGLLSNLFGGSGGSGGSGFGGLQGTLPGAVATPVPGVPEWKVGFGNSI